MAEIVQFQIESSIRELEQLERVGLFTATEVKKIIKRRKAFEYRIARQHKSKEDFLKYIQYELAVLSLVKKRRESLGFKFKKDDIDNAIGKKIHNLFMAAIKRYPQDTKLWLSHRGFLKRMNWSQKMSGILTKMLQFHSKSPGHWIVVAKWEMEENNSPESARQICQRAIRFHPESQLLWREYFRMELMYAYQMRKRREILKIKGEENQEENDEILDGKIALVVYKQATVTVPDLEFALSFLPVCSDFDFTEEHETVIYQDVQERFPESEETWDALAKRHLKRVTKAELFAAEEGVTKKQAVRKVIDDAFGIYEEAVQKIATEKMWTLYIQCILERMEKARSEKKVKKMLSQVLLLMSKASDLSLLSSDLSVEWVRLLTTCGEHEEALNVALKSLDKTSQNSKLWTDALILLAQNQDSRFVEYFNKAVETVPEKESYPLWQLGIEWGTLNDSDQLIAILEKGIKRGPKISVPLKMAYLEVVAMQRGPAEARDLYNRLKNFKPLSVEFYEKMFFIESSELEPSVSRMRKYFEDAILEFGTTSVEAWMKYITFELQHPKGKPESAGKLYWRAVKTLSPLQCDEFIHKHTMLSTGHDLSKY